MGDPYLCVECGSGLAGIRVINRGLTRRGGHVCGACATLPQQRRLQRRQGAARRRS